MFSLVVLVITNFQLKSIVLAYMSHITVHKPMTYILTKASTNSLLDSIALASSIAYLHTSGLMTTCKSKPQHRWSLYMYYAHTHTHTHTQCTEMCTMLIKASTVVTVITNKVCLLHVPRSSVMHNIHVS